MGALFSVLALQRNVLVSKQGHALLTDFSFSSLVEYSFDTSAAAPIRPTLRWMPPEEIRGSQTPNEASDVWSFGMTALVRQTRYFNPFNSFYLL